MTLCFFSQGKTVTLKIKTVQFEVRTRATSLRNVTQQYDVIYDAAAKLLKHEMTLIAPKPLRLRLMGVYNMYLFIVHVLNCDPHFSKILPRILECGLG